MISYYLYKFAFFLSNKLPLKMAYSVAAFLTLLKYYVSPRDRRAVCSNLKKINPQATKREIRRMARSVFMNFGLYLVEFFRMKKDEMAEIDKKVTILGLEHIDRALAGGKGVIVLSAHVGNWELGGVLMSQKGYPVIGVALPHKHRKVNDLFNKQRETLGMVVVPSLGVAIRKIYQALRENKIVALVGDRDFANSGLRLPFLGDHKVIPRGPAVLALRTGAPIIAGFVVRQPDNTFVLEFRPPLDADGSEDNLIRRYASMIEDLIRKHPDQWLMFRELGKE